MPVDYDHDKERELRVQRTRERIAQLEAETVRLDAELRAARDQAEPQQLVKTGSQ